MSAAGDNDDFMNGIGGGRGDSTEDDTDMERERGDTESIDVGGEDNDDSYEVEKDDDEDTEEEHTLEKSVGGGNVGLVESDGVEVLVTTNDNVGSNDNKDGVNGGVEVRSEPEMVPEVNVSVEQANNSVDDYIVVEMSDAVVGSDVTENESHDNGKKEGKDGEVKDLEVKEVEGKDIVEGKGESETVVTKVQSVNRENREEMKKAVTTGTVSYVTYVEPKVEMGPPRTPIRLPVMSSNENYVSKEEGRGDLYPVNQRNWAVEEKGSDEEREKFMLELEQFFKERGMDFKAPKFYGEGLNLLKLFNSVVALGGYDTVTTCKLWRQVGESFKPPKTCTTVSWSFRCFYEKSLLDYERHKMRTGELRNIVSQTDPASPDTQMGNYALGSNTRVRRDSANRAQQTWNNRLFGNGEAGEPLNKEDMSLIPSSKGKHSGSGTVKRKPGPKPHNYEQATKIARTMALTKVPKSQVDMDVSDIGPQADWVKINVRRTKDCFEVYALVPGLLREEVRVQSDPAGRLVITGDPEQPDNPWGVTPFKKVVTLPSRIDPHQTSAVVTLHGQLFVRVPFEQPDL